MPVVRKGCEMFMQVTLQGSDLGCGRYTGYRGHSLLRGRCCMLAEDPQDVARKLETSMWGRTSGKP
jgi:hypothetical protein